MWIIFFFIGLILIILACKLSYKRRYIYQWRRKLNLPTHQRAFNQLYANINGFLLSRENRKDKDFVDLVYGEIDFESFIALLTLCNPHSHTIFYDLGSGTGKAVLACAMVFNVHKSMGIELLPNLYQCSESQRHRLAGIKDYSENARTIHFKQGNFLDISIADATLVFINSTAFFAELWQTMSKHLEIVKPGTYIISTSKALASPKFFTKKTTLVQMSWGLAKAFIQVRLPDN